MKIQFRLRFINFLLPTLFLGLVLFSCKSINPAINPGPSTPPANASAGVNVPLKIPQEILSKLLDSQIPTVLLQEKGLNMGSGIIGDLLLKRNGKIRWTALDSQRIQLTVPINVIGEVGLKPKGLGSLFQAKLPLNEDFSPVFVIDPVINSNWSIGAESFELIELGGNLALDVLGMKVDLSGLLSKELKNWGQENLSGGKELASLKTLVDLAWSQVGKPFSVEWMGGNTAFSIQPQQVKIKEFFDSQQNYNLWLGIDGKVNAHPADAAPSRAFPLPNLSSNANDANELEILIPMSISYSTLDELLQQNLEGKAFQVDKKTILIPSNIRTQAFGNLLAINMDFIAEQTNGKSVNGTLFVVGKPVYNAATQSLQFKDVNFKMESGSFGAQTGVGLKKRKIIKNIERRAIFQIGDLMATSMESIQDRMGISTPIANLKIENLEITPAGFYPMKNELLIQFKAVGNVGVQWK